MKGFFLALDGMKKWKRDLGYLSTRWYEKLEERLGLSSALLTAQQPEQLMAHCEEKSLLHRRATQFA